MNGERAFGFEEWKNGMRLDRHRFKAKLKAGPNAVLVKDLPGTGNPGNPDTNWEFVLLGFATSRGVASLSRSAAVGQITKTEAMRSRISPKKTGQSSKCFDLAMYSPFYC